MEVFIFKRNERLMTVCSGAGYQPDMQYFLLTLQTGSLDDSTAAQSLASPFAALSNRSYRETADA